MTGFWRQLAAWALDVLVPARCAACGESGRDLCDRCSSTLKDAQPIRRAALAGAPPATALGAYDGTLRAAILALKFRGARGLGVRIGRWLAPKINWPYEIIVSVPLHSIRMRERGYNQADLIARGIAQASGLPCIAGALVRLRATQPQSALDVEFRLRNVEGAFGPGPQSKRIQGRRVLLVDDVVTTGATGRACANTLSAAGARVVYLASGAIRL